MKHTDNNKTASAWLYASLVLILSSLLTYAGWFVSQHNADIKLQSMAVTSATLLSQRSSELLLANDLLALQNVVRMSSQLPQVHYAGIYDIAGMPLAESGTVSGIANTFSASAPVYTGSSQVAIATISIETPSASKYLWELYGIPILLTILMLFWLRKPQTTTNNNEEYKLETPCEPIALIAIDYTADDLNEPAFINQLEQALSFSCDLYGAQYRRQGKDYLITFNDSKEGALNAVCAARLWYGAFINVKKQLSLTLSSSIILSSWPENSGNKRQIQFMQTEHIQQLQSTCSDNKGILLSHDFMSLQSIATSVVVSDGKDVFRLKRLNDGLDKLVRKQLSQVMHKLSI